MEPVDAGPDCLVGALARKHVAVKHGIGEAEALLVGRAREAVRGRLVDERPGQSERMADLANLVHEKVRERAEVARGVAVLRRVADPVLGKIAGVGDAPALREHLADGIERRHADAGGHVDRGVPREAVRARQLEQSWRSLERAPEALDRRMNVDLDDPDAEHARNLPRILDVGLHAVRHEHAHDAPGAERLHAERGRHGRVLAAREPHHGAALRAVLFKIPADPFRKVVRRLPRVREHSSPFTSFADGAPRAALPPVILAAHPPEGDSHLQARPGRERRSSRVEYERHAKD